MATEPTASLNLSTSLIQRVLNRAGITVDGMRLHWEQTPDTQDHVGDVVVATLHIADGWVIQAAATGYMRSAAQRAMSRTRVHPDGDLALDIRLQDHLERKAPKLLQHTSMLPQQASLHALVQRLRGIARAATGLGESED